MSTTPLDVSNLALLRKMSVDEVARWLEVHPFDVVRSLTLTRTLPADLRLDTQHVDRVRDHGALEVWWDGADIPEDDGKLLAGLIARLLTRLTAPSGTPRVTRADNLLRGLEPERQAFLRRAVNQLVRLGYLDIRGTPSGIGVTLRQDHAADLGALAVDFARLHQLVLRAHADAGLT